MKKPYIPKFITDLERKDRVLVRKGYSMEKWTLSHPCGRNDEDDLPFETVDLSKLPRRIIPNDPVRHVWLDEDLEKTRVNWRGVEQEAMMRDLDDMIACLDEEIARLEAEEKKKISYNLVLVDVDLENRAAVRKVLREKTELPFYQINDMLRDLPATIYCKDQDEAEELMAELEDAGGLVIRSYHDGLRKTEEELAEENNFEAAFKAYVKNCEYAKLEEMVKEVEAEIKHRDREEAARRVWIYSTEGNDAAVVRVLHENSCMDLEKARSIVKNLPDYIPCHTKEFASFICRRINEVGGIAERGCDHY